MGELRTALRVCPLCESTCGLELSLRGDRVVDVQGHAGDVFSGGYLCPKGANLGALDEDPDRLVGPLVRRDGVLQPAGWEEAFAVAAAGLRGVRERFGAQANAVYMGNPSAHNLAGAPFNRVVAKALGTRNIYSAGSLDTIPLNVACGELFGGVGALPIPDVDRTMLLVAIGANPVVSNGSVATAPNFPGRLRALRERGGRLVVVDPAVTRTAELADLHLSVRPATDAYLLLGMVNTLFSEGLVALGEYADLVGGVDELERMAAPFTAEVVAGVCDVAADAIRGLARELAAAESAAVYGRVGTCQVRHGTVTNWLIHVLNVLTGNVDRAGGVMFPQNPTRPAHERERPYVMGRHHSRVRGLPELMGELPAATLADEIATPGEGQVRGLVTIAGNPVLAIPNGGRLGDLLSDLDFMVSIDPYLNETTVHADVILPPPRILQAGHFDWLLSVFQVRAVVRYSPPVVDLPADRPSEADILIRLGTMIAGGEPAPEPAQVIDQQVARMVQRSVTTLGSSVHGRDPDELLAQLSASTYIERYLDAMLRLGPFGDAFGANPDGVTLDKLIEHPEGIDYGPMVPRLSQVLCHPDGKIHLWSPLVAEQVAVLTEELTRPRPEFVLIGRRKLRSHNSWLHNVPNLVSGPDDCTLHINTADADRLGIARGDRVMVRSRPGDVVVPAEPTDTVRPGVVSLPHGWGHRVPGTQLSTAATAAGISANDITDDDVIDTLSGNAVFNGVPVELTPL